jgi:hypothetical protein
MNLINVEDENGNWWEALALWSKVVNWSHYKTSPHEFQAQVKALLGYLWNEKDWLVAEFPQQKKLIENFINRSKHIRVVADLANTVKHRKLTRPPRSQAKQTHYYGRVGTGKSERKLYFIEVAPGKHWEIMEILRGALNEYEALKHELQAARSNHSLDRPAVR